MNKEQDPLGWFENYSEERAEKLNLLFAPNNKWERQPSTNY